MILGHTYYGPIPKSPQALAFRDADVLDFLGMIGVARILAVTEEPGFSDGTFKPTVRTLQSFADTMASKCILASCKQLAAPRQRETQTFLQQLNAYTFSGAAL